MLVPVLSGALNFSTPKLCIYLSLLPEIMKWLPVWIHEFLIFTVIVSDLFLYLNYLFLDLEIFQVGKVTCRYLLFLDGDSGKKEFCFIFLNVDVYFA